MPADALGRMERAAATESVWDPSFGLPPTFGRWLGARPEGVCSWPLAGMPSVERLTDTR